MPRRDRKGIRIGPRKVIAQGLEIEKHPLNVFSIILDPAFYREVHLIETFYNIVDLITGSTV